MQEPVSGEINMNRYLLVTMLAGLLAACATAPKAGNHEAVLAVMATERAFARTLADRDITAFAGFIDQEAIFFADTKPLRGKSRVVEAWSRFFEGETAPFSWEPDQVEVLDSGNLALSSGPVRNAEGKTVARFNSIWRRDKRNRWQIIFDKGNAVCE